MDDAPELEAGEVTDTLDLHGFFPEQVAEALDAFFENAQVLGLEYLKVIHGKGKSRLKWEVHQFLKADERVIDFTDAPPDSGGWGATLVRIHRF